MKPIDPGLPETVIGWLRVWRAVVLEPLRAADPPWTLERMAAELGRRAGGERLEGGARAEASGTAKPSLQRFFAGTRVPARDVVQHLLDIACETLSPPPTCEQISDLWAAYRAALRTTYALLADLYDAVDARDAARSRAEYLQQEKDQVTGDLALSQQREQRLQALLQHAAAELEHAQQTAALRDDEARLAEAKAEQLARYESELENQLRQSLQDQARLEQEIDLLCGQDGMLTGRIAELEGELDTLREDNEELAQTVSAVSRTLRDAEQQVQQLQSAGALERRYQLSLRGPGSAAELEQRHQVAIHAVQHLSEQLRSVSRELAHARAELVRRDGALARLVQEHAEEIASLRADRVLAEADTVLSLALQDLDPAPAALPPASDVPTPETTVPLRSAGSAASSQRSTPVDPPRKEQRGSAPDGSRMRSPAAPAGDADPVPRRPRPVHAAASPTTTAGRRTSRAGTRAGPSRRTVSIVTASLGAVVAGAFGLSRALDFPGDHKAAPSTTASVSPSASASPLPTAAKDPVADIGNQDVNTAAIMKLAACRARDIDPSIRSVHNSYEARDKPRIELTVKGNADGRLPCRINLSRASAPLTITQAGADAALWATSTCTAGHDGPRWLQVTRHSPATIDFHWNRRPNEKSCTASSLAPTSTYLVEALVLKKQIQTSFVLAEASPETSPAATPSTNQPTPSFSIPDNFIQGQDGGGNGGSTESSPATASSSSSDSDGGSNGSGGNNGGIFGGPSG
ncbi:hypothetical protein [Streptomyces sp. bgisy027]|uniref:hypothetical protein n=1 Tax=Streptomyces sp. bgisy027 TaxID=3413770 RepID=UPI003D74985E